MPERIELTLTPDADPESWPDTRWREVVAEHLDVDPQSLRAARPHRISFDARRRAMYWQVSVDVWRDEEPPPPIRLQGPPRIAAAPADAPHVVVIGSGPAGLYCALELVRHGLRATVCERGEDAQTRRKAIARLNRGEEVDPESNYAFGEGGAGTYSDGKLYTRSHKRGDLHAVLHTLVAHGAPESILASWRPHIGSNLLPKVVQAMRATLESAGCPVRFGARVTELLTSAPGDGGAPAVRGVRLADGEEIAADAVVMATGHSALDALLLARAAGARLEAKGFAVGVRVEHSQAWLDAVQYHGRREEAGLPPSFYEFACQVDERGIYSFCMCPGGWIVPSQSTPGTLVVNGMSLAKRDSPYANSGLVVELQPKDWCGKRGWRWGWSEILQRAAALSDHPALHEEVVDPRGGPSLAVAQGRLPVHPEQDPLFGVRLQLALETLAAHAGGGAGRAPAQRCCDFVEGTGAAQEPLASSYLPGLTAADFDQLLPKGVARRLRQGLLEFDAKMPGFAGDRGQIIGVETRTSSPVRMVRDVTTLQAEGCSGLFPCGEGAGYAGGIVSAALDGIRVATAVRESVRLEA